MDTPIVAKPFEEVLTDALRYWEKRRIPYNLALAAVVIAYTAVTWPHFQPGLLWINLLRLFVMAVGANLCYSTVYLVDIPVQYSEYQATWRRWRGGLWLAGTLFAAVLTLFWLADEIYPAIGG